MPEGAIEVPPGLTTQGLLGRRYMARLIDSAIILLLIGAAVLMEAVIVSGLLSRMDPDSGNGVGGPDDLGWL